MGLGPDWLTLVYPKGHDQAVRFAVSAKENCDPDLTPALGKRTAERQKKCS